MSWKTPPNLNDSPRERRIRRAEKITGTQIMPRMARVNFWCMILMTCTTVILEAVQFFRFSRELGFSFFLKRGTEAALLSWSFFALILVIVSMIQMGRLRNGHVETRYVERPPGDDSDPFVPIVDPRPKYVRYIRTAVVGEIVLLLLFVILRLL